MFLCTLSAQAQKTWNAATGDWANDLNWQPLGAPSTSSNAIINNGGTAQVTSSDTAGSLSLGSNLGNSGTVSISGTAGLLTINGGIIANAGTGTVNISAGGRYNFGSASLALGLDATGRGTVTIDGASSLLFGTADVNIAVLGTSAVTLTNGGALQADDLYLGNNTGVQTGTLNVRSASQVTLTNLLIVGNNANGTVNVDGPTSLLTSNGGSIGFGGIGTVNLTNGGNYNYGAGNLSVGTGAGVDGTVTIDGTGSKLQGTGTATIGGSGTGTMAITKGGAAVVSSATLGSSVGSSGTLTVDGATSLFQTTSGLVIGLNGAGTATVTGGATLNAGATITLASSAGSSGTLNIGQGGAPGIVIGNISGGSGTAIVDFNHSDSAYIFSSVMSGTLAVKQSGSGTTILTGDNSYSGGTIIEDGTLVAGTPNAAQEISFALGTGNVFLQGGTLRTPSLDPLTINVGGNYTQGTAGTLALGVAGINGAQYDHVQVGRDASLDGTLSVSSLNNFRPRNGNAFEVLRSNGTTSGQFSNIVDNLNNNADLQRVDVYAKNGVALVYIAPVLPPPTLPPGVTPTPPPPITVEDPNPLPPVEPDAPLPLPELVTIIDPTVEQLTSLYEVSFSGANMQRFNLGDRMFQIQHGMTGFVSPITPAPPPAPTGKEINEGKGVEGKAPPPALQPGPTNRWGVWANGWGDFVHLDDTGGYNFTTGGMSAGVDYLITDHFAVGLFGGYSHTSVNFTPSGSATVNTGRGGLYATYFNQGWWVNAAAWGGGNSYSTSRQALAGQANGETDGYEVSTFGDAGYDFHYGDLAFGPTISMQYTDVHISGFGEHGSLVPLNIHGDSQDSLRTDLGGQAYYKWRVGNIPVVPTVRLAWEHEYFYANLPITASAPTLDGATATFSGPDEGHDSLIINANIAVQWTPRIWTTIGYDGQVARDNYNSNAVTGSFSFSF